MGLFDTCTELLHCPFCGYAQNGWQTKSLGNDLFSYSLEEIKVEMARRIEKTGVMKRIELHTICENNLCRAFVSINIDVLPSKTVKCPICGDPYVVMPYYTGDQSACPKCRAEACKTTPNKWQ